MKKLAYKLITISAALMVMFGSFMSVYADDGQDLSEEISEADRDTYIYGLAGFTECELLGMSLGKKSVAYVTHICDSAGNPVGDKDVVQGRYYRFEIVEAVNTDDPEVRFSYKCLGGITYDFFSEARYDTYLHASGEDGKTAEQYLITREELKEADVIVSAGCVSQDAMAAALGSEKYTGVLIGDVPEDFGVSDEDAKYALSAGYFTGCAYSELLNPVDICAYYYEQFGGLSDSEELAEKIKTVFEKISFYRGYPNTLSEAYRSDTVKNMLVKGSYFFLDNPDVFSGGAFDSNGMSSWEPDFELKGSILGGPDDSADEESETTESVAGETETETTEAETTETETAVIETVSEPAESETAPETAPVEISTEEVSAEETSLAETIDNAGIPVWIGAAVGGIFIAAAIVVLVVYLKKKNGWN